MLRDNKGDMTSIMIGLMVALIIFAVALATIMPTINTSCEYQAVVNETFNSSTQDVYVQLGNTSIVSGSETVTTTNGSTTYTRDTDYKMNYTDGKIMSLSTGAMDNYTDYYISYNYKDAAYIESATTRMIVRYIPLMLAIAALVVVVGAIGKY